MGNTERCEPQHDVSREEYDSHHQDVLRFPDQQRREKFHDVSLEYWMSAAQNNCVRNLVAFVAYADQV